MRNISDDNLIFQKGLEVFQASKWTIHACWLLLGLVGGVLGGLFFHPNLRPGILLKRSGADLRA